MAGEQKVAFTEDAAKRVAAATLAYERGNRDMSPIKFRQSGGDGNPIRNGKTTAVWLKNTLATIELYEDGEPPNETKGSPVETLERCVNKFTDVQSGKWVTVALAANGYYYLIAAEC